MASKDKIGNILKTEVWTFLWILFDLKTLNGTVKLHPVIWAVAAEADWKYDPQILAENK